MSKTTIAKDTIQETAKKAAELVLQTAENAEVKKKRCDEIKDIVREEIAVCFKEITDNQKRLSDDMLEIKTALLGSGNKYKTDKGLAEMIRVSYDYVDANIKNRVMDRANPTMEHYEEWRDNGNWNALERIILDNIISNKMKLFFGVGSWAGIVAFISSLIVVVGWLSGWFVK